MECRKTLKKLCIAKLYCIMTVLFPIFFSTVNTLNTSLTSDDLVDDVPNEIDIFPSASRVKKVHNWMLDQKPKVEKKQSLITVIGQTQGRDTLR